MKNLQLDQFDAFLFDLDGTLVDSMELHNNAWITALAELGYQMTHEILHSYAGVPTLKTAQIFNEKFGWNLDAEAFALEKESRFLEKISQVKPILEVIEIVHQYLGKKPMAIVSGGVREVVFGVLSAIDLHHAFPIKICAEDTTRGKPFPDPFLKAAELLGISPERCLVFEDGEAGIKAAQASGMGVVKVVSDPERNSVVLTRL